MVRVTEEEGEEEERGRGMATVVMEEGRGEEDGGKGVKHWFEVESTPLPPTPVSVSASSSSSLSELYRKARGCGSPESYLECPSHPPPPLPESLSPDSYLECPQLQSPQHHPPQQVRGGASLPEKRAVMMGDGGAPSFSSSTTMLPRAAAPEDPLWYRSFGSKLHVVDLPPLPYELAHSPKRVHVSSLKRREEEGIIGSGPFNASLSLSRLNERESHVPPPPPQVPADDDATTIPFLSPAHLHLHLHHHHSHHHTLHKTVSDSTHHVPHHLHHPHNHTITGTMVGPPPALAPPDPPSSSPPPPTPPSVEQLAALVLLQHQHRPLKVTHSGNGINNTNNINKERGQLLEHHQRQESQKVRVTRSLERKAGLPLPPLPTDTNAHHQHQLSEETVLR